MTHNLGDLDKIDSAEVVNNVVRVSKEHNDIARVMRETHFFYVPKDTLFLRVIDAGEWVSFCRHRDRRKQSHIAFLFHL